MADKTFAVGDLVRNDRHPGIGRVTFVWGPPVCEASVEWMGGVIETHAFRHLWREMPDTRIDTYGTDEITCPWCGVAWTDSWEWRPGDEDGEADCGDCGKQFLVSRCISVTYTTTKQEDDNG